MKKIVHTWSRNISGSVSSINWSWWVAISFPRNWHVTVSGKENRLLKSHSLKSFSLYNLRLRIIGFLSICSNFCHDGINKSYLPGGGDPGVGVSIPVVKCWSSKVRGKFGEGPRSQPQLPIISPHVFCAYSYPSKRQFQMILWCIFY